MNVLYFVASPLHVLTAYTYLLSDKEEGTTTLCVVNSSQKFEKTITLYQNASKTSFSNIIHLKRLSSPFKEKLNEHSSLNTIKALIEDLKPEKIYTSNDRRIECQYAIYLAKKHQNCKTIYVDEGIYTYIKRTSKHKKANNPIRNKIKRWLYGKWWEDTNQVGESSHIDEKIVFFPQAVTSKKRTIRFPSETFQTSEFKHLCQQLLSGYNINIDKLAQAEFIYTLPFETLLLDNLAYRQSLTKKLEDVSQHCRLFVKNHPRNTKNANELLQLKNKFELIPSTIPFELILPFLNNCTIMADISSTLLLCRLIRPDLKTQGLSTTLANDYEDIQHLFESADIPITKESIKNGRQSN